MAFLDRDPLESYMGVRVEDMTPDQLVTYLKEYQLNLNGLDLKIKGHPEYKRMRWLQETYGQSDAGRIIKWTYWKHRGRWRNSRGAVEIVRPMRFNDRMKWWVDIMHLEMQLQVNRELQQEKSPVVMGFATGDDL